MGTEWISSIVLGGDHWSSWAKFVHRRVVDEFDCLRRLGPEFVSHQQTLPLEKLLLTLPLKVFCIAGTRHVASTCVKDRLLIPRKQGLEASFTSW
jgi:hypothetical protein